MTLSPDGDSDLAKSEDLLRRAAQAQDMAERGRLIDEAAWWRFRAHDVASGPQLAALGGEDDLSP